MFICGMNETNVKVFEVSNYELLEYVIQGFINENNIHHSRVVSISHSVIYIGNNSNDPFKSDRVYSAILLYN